MDGQLSTPTHRDEAAMNGAQLREHNTTDSQPMSGPPAEASTPTHRDETAMNGAQTVEWVTCHSSGNTTRRIHDRWAGHLPMTTSMSPPTHRDKAAMNGAQTVEWASCRGFDSHSSR